MAKLTDVRDTPLRSPTAQRLYRGACEGRVPPFIRAHSSLWTRAATQSPAKKAAELDRCGPRRGDSDRIRAQTASWSSASLAAYSSLTTPLPLRIRSPPPMCSRPATWKTTTPSRRSPTGCVRGWHSSSAWMTTGVAVEMRIRLTVPAAADRKCGRLIE